jgi:hypothetical protein
VPKREVLPSVAEGELEKSREVFRRIGMKENEERVARLLVVSDKVSKKKTRERGELVARVQV